MKIEEWIKNQYKISYKYYYSQLNHITAKCYQIFCDALIHYKKEFILPTNNISICEQAYEHCLLDNPVFFYVSEILYFRELFNIKVIIKYDMSKIEIQNVIQKIDDELYELKKCCHKMSDLNKEKIIHDVIIQNIEYENNDKLSAHMAYSVFTNKKSVCDGISKAAKMMFDNLGINSIVVYGEAISQNKENDYIYEKHAWNMVKVQGGFYHLDITFDVTLSCNKENFYRHDYFNLTEEQIKKDHIWMEKVPATPVVERDYFSLKNQIVISETQLENMLIKSFIYDCGEIKFRAKGELSYNFSVELFKRCINNAVEELGVGICLKYTLMCNYNQRVVYIIYDKRIK